MDTKRYYPAFLDLTGRLVVVIGPAEGLARKARQLSKYGADVLVVTPEPSPELLQGEAEGAFGIEPRAYVRGDLSEAALAMCLNPDEEVRRAVSAEAKQVGCPLSVSGSPRLSTFLAPSVVHREPLQIAISTGGAAPQLAKHVRRRIGAEFGEEWGAFSELFVDVRALAAERIDEEEAIEALLADVLASDTLSRIRSGETVTAEETYRRFAPANEAAEEAAEEEDESANDQQEELADD